MVMDQVLRKGQRNNQNNNCVLSLQRKSEPTYNSICSTKRYFLSQEIECCPREKFRHDISEFISSCTNKNEQIILCIDLNKDTTRTNGPLYQTLLHENNLIDTLKYRHEGLNSPTTHNRGTKPIDAIMISLNG